MSRNVGSSIGDNDGIESNTTGAFHNQGSSLISYNRMPVELKEFQRNAMNVFYET